MRCLVAVLLCAGLAAAGDFVVRVTVGVEPAPDAIVTIVNKDAGIVFDSAAVRADAKTDATGQAVVRVEPGDRVLVYKPGFALAVAETTGDLVDVALRPERVFEARVVDAKGEPLGGVAVFLMTWNRREATLRARSDDKGRAFIYGLWFDDYEVGFEKDGYTSHRAYMDDLDPLRVTLLREATVTGVAQDREGKPLAGIVVDFGEREAETDASGAFRFDHCASGASDGVVLSVGAPYKGSVKVEPFGDGERRVLLPLLVERPVTVRARVFDELEKPLAGVNAWDGGRRARSDEKGALALRIRPGERTRVKLDGLGLQWQWLTIEPRGGGATVDLGDVVMRPLPRIEVQVRHPDGRLVEAGSIGEWELVNGVATVVGEYGWTITVEGYPPVHTDRLLAPGPVSVTLPRPIWVEGRVLDFAGAPFHGIKVYSAEAETTTDAEGAFRLGPGARENFRVTAESGDRKRTIVAEPSDTELEIRMPRARPDLVRGRVLRGTTPVTRFAVNEQRVTDESGRFEVVVDRAVDRGLRIQVGDFDNFLPLPPPGEDAVLRLPAGRIEVTVDGGEGDVSLFLHGRRERYRETEDGVAVFDGLAPGRYRVVEDEGASQEVELARDAVVSVRLERRRASLLTVVTAAWTHRERLPAGRHAEVSMGSTQLRDLRMPDEDLRIDLVTAASGALVVRARDFAGIWLERRLDSCLAIHYARVHGDEHRFTALRTGPYEIVCEGIRRSVTIERGKTTTVMFDDARVTWSGRALLHPERPAAGATVSISLDDTGWLRTTQANTSGRFRFTGLAPGTYRCRVSADDHLPVVRTVVVADDADEPAFVLRRPVGRITFVGPSGTRLRAGQAVLVDGATIWTDELGDVEIAGATARIDLDIPGYASLRGRVVQPGDVVRLQLGASLVLRTDAAADRIQVRMDGVRFDRLEAGEGGFVLDDLPAGLAEIEIAPAEDGEEPRIVRATLRPGVETRLDLGG